MRRGCKVTSPLTSPSTKKSDGTKKFTTTDSMDGCSILLETQLVGTRLRVDTTQVLSVEAFLPPMVTVGESPQFVIQPPLWALHLLLPRSYLLNFFHKGILPQDSWDLKSEFSLSQVSCQRPSSLTCLFACYTVDNSVPTCGPRLRPSH